MKSAVRRFHAKKIAFLSLLTGLALTAFLLESLLPAPPVPGAKLGFSNAFTLLANILYGFPEAFLLVTARTVTASLFIGNPSMLLYSFTAGIIGAAIQRILLLFSPRVSVVGVSCVSAVCHNLVQLTVYCLLTGTTTLLKFSPYLVLSGIASGIIVGLAVAFTVKYFPLSALPAAERSEVP